MCCNHYFVVAFQRLQHKVEPKHLKVNLNYPKEVPVTETGFTNTGLSLEEFLLKRRDFGKNKFKEAPLPQYEFLYSKNAPATIAEADVGKMNLIDNEDYAKYFSVSGFGGQLDKNFSLAAHRALLIREPVIPIVQELTKIAKKQGTDQRGYVLVGQRGSGKSSVFVFFCNFFVHQHHSCILD